ncbi:MAG: hypothetical protein ACK2UK_19135, partial [Candidatus Promineifilaceae bacterium]
MSLDRGDCGCSISCRAFDSFGAEVKGILVRVALISRFGNLDVVAWPLGNNGAAALLGYDCLRKEFIVYAKLKLIAIGVFGTALLVLSACSGSKQSESVEQDAEEVVTRIVEMEVTRVVEVPVEITRIFRDVQVVTPTPLPTETPSAPERGNFRNPYPLGSTARLIRGDFVFDLTVLEVLRGEEAQARVLAADEENDEAPPGTE